MKIYTEGKLNEEARGVYEFNNRMYMLLICPLNC